MENTMEYIFTKEQYLQAKAVWKSLKKKTAFDHLIYNIIRSKDPKTGFTPITNQTKLNCNCGIVSNPDGKGWIPDRYYTLNLQITMLGWRFPRKVIADGMFDREDYIWNGIRITYDQYDKALPTQNPYGLRNIR